MMGFFAKTIGPQANWIGECTLTNGPKPKQILFVDRYLVYGYIFKGHGKAIIHKYNLVTNFDFICVPYQLEAIFRYITYTKEKRNAPSEAQ